MDTILKRGLLWLLVAAAALWGGDWTVWQIRNWHGGGTGSVDVQQFLKTPLKGQKTEFDYLGNVAQPCARSLFPHGGNSACWWLRRHPTQWES